MRKIFVLLLILGAIFENINAGENETNDDKLKIYAGIILTPQLSMNATKTNVNIENPIFAGGTIAFGELSITPCYEITEKKGCLFLKQNINRKHEISIYCMLAFGKKESFYSLGFEKEIKNGSAFFLEFGAREETRISVGIFVPIMIKF
jgi:hypothetical protein